MFSIFCFFFRKLENSWYYTWTNAFFPLFASVTLLFYKSMLSFLGYLKWPLYLHARLWKTLNFHIFLDMPWLFIHGAYSWVGPLIRNRVLVFALYQKEAERLDGMLRKRYTNIILVIVLYLLSQHFLASCWKYNWKSMLISMSLFSLSFFFELSCWTLIFFIRVSQTIFLIKYRSSR
jgi:hypothetical protein